MKLFAVLGPLRALWVSELSSRWGLFVEDVEDVNVFEA